MTHLGGSSLGTVALASGELRLLQPPGAPAVFAALESRSSVRAYLDQPVPLGTVERILQAAARAPSGNNSQPWRVHVLTGAPRDRLGDAVLAWRATNPDDPAPEYAYYPDTWPEPYLSRRRANGWDLYGLLGIAKGDRTKARAWHDANFRFFGAPVGMIITQDRRLGLGALIDLGMFMEGIAVAARGLGLDTCPQAAWAHHHAIIRQQLALPPENMVVCTRRRLPGSRAVDMGIFRGYRDGAATAMLSAPPRPVQTGRGAKFSGQRGRAPAGKSARGPDLQTMQME